jgi:cytochrome c biogenesis factor
MKTILKISLFNTFVLFWTLALALIGFAIFKFGLYDTIRQWNYPNWDGLDWILYILGICVYVAFFVLTASILTNILFNKLFTKPVKPE